ncbi:protein kinase C and casein kinase substrate in neurons protein 2-like isoform X1 [Oncorhynchus nerka]|uniref:protein kinase C and casein kinase substrate in neurons protein 2-like isoform X1 n=1 Tax=Oncorhynchus nerka TaxID=8023 RepID=UPI0011317EEF|nr:protein kinase C and casein kinase substrate in neurons protein 2-like isoform X1 [Oncorhynchus nerka]XP_029521539.1 protein kinase C and casein kinase substrate in neurons protein 2-like isoform X1 [Oncorhynchus nerka]
MSGSYDDSMVDVSSDSFWEVGNYKRAVRRVDDGSRLCNDLMNCLHERARIEKSYAQQLTEWSKRWRQLIEKGPQYGTLERAWGALCTEAEKVSELHMEVKAVLMGEDCEKLKVWQRDYYHKQMIGGFKETKEADDGFRKAQKPWAKKLKEMETMKKAYHGACKEEKLATSRENNSKLENHSNPEAQKKLQDKVEKCQQEMEKTKERYEKSLEELDKVTPQYMENMEQVFEQWQQFEDKRITFFKALLLEVKHHLDLSTNHKFQTVYHTLEDTISAADAVEDLKWFRSNHGPGMPMNWPQFENVDWSRSSRSRRSIVDWSIDLNRTLSRRETKKKPSEGVTLTGISQMEEQQAAKSSSSLTVPTSTEPVGSNPFEEDDDEDLQGTVKEQPAVVNNNNNSSPLNVKKVEEVKTASSVEKSQEWSDEETGVNPFSIEDANGDGNPFEVEPASSGVSVAVRALYDYEGQEQDELSFKAGEEFTKIGNEDDQGWCRGRLKDGVVGLYPANYVEDIQ